MTLRPQAGVIVVHRGLSSTGFFLGRDRRLSLGDRARLERTLAQTAATSSSGDVRQELRSSIQQYRRYEALLNRQGGVITSLLRRAASTGKAGVLWERGNAQITYNTANNVLVGSTPWGQQGFFLRRTAGGLTVRPESLEKLQSFLLRHSQ